MAIKDTTKADIRTALLSSGNIKPSTSFVPQRTTSKEESMTSAIASRRAEMNKLPTIKEKQ